MAFVIELRVKMLVVFIFSPIIPPVLLTHTYQIASLPYKYLLHLTLQQYEHYHQRGIIIRNYHKIYAGTFY
jgi:hypothetical protein